MGDQYLEGKTNLDLLEQDIVSGSGISWAKCKSHLAPSQHSATQFLQARCASHNQQHQSTESTKLINTVAAVYY